MGLKELLSKEGRAGRSLRKNVARAVDKHAQSVDRLKALEDLAKEGSDEALFGLLRRFSLTYDKSIEDEEEKTWVYETVVGLSAQALPALRRYLLEAESLSWPLRLLSSVAPSKEALWEVVVALLARHEPGYVRDPSAKIQLLGWLADEKDPRAVAALVPYLQDVDEGVRFCAAEGLFGLKDAAALGPLCDALVRPEEESLRLRVRIADGLAELAWAVEPARRKAVEARLPEGFALEPRTGRLVRPKGSRP